MLGSAVSASPLTGFRGVCITRQQVSLYVTACTLARAAVQSPPAPLGADRPARLQQSLPRPGSPPVRVCYHYSAQPPIAEAGLSPARLSKNEGCTTRTSQGQVQPSRKSASRFTIGSQLSASGGRFPFSCGFDRIRVANRNFMVRGCAQA